MRRLLLNIVQVSSDLAFESLEYSVETKLIGKTNSCDSPICRYGYFDLNLSLGMLAGT